MNIKRSEFPAYTFTDKEARFVASATRSSIPAAIFIGGCSSSREELCVPPVATHRQQRTIITMATMVTNSNYRHFFMAIFSPPLNRRVPVRAFLRPPPLPT